MAAPKDLTGQRFGRLTVLRLCEEPYISPSGKKTRRWICRCDCGREIVTTRKALLTGKKLSCGCLLSEAAAKRVDAAVGHYDGTTISAIKPDRQANKNSRSGVKGVYWSDREQIWIAKITVRRKAITIGRYKTLDEAAAARREAEEKYFAPILAIYDDR